jgi:catalase-peroxidase
MTSESKCPFPHGSRGPMNRDWWPNQLDVQVLHQHSALSNPMGEAFDYAKAFKSLDLDAVIKDLHALMTDSQDWWPADFGHYGGLFIRMAWHSAGTYRIADGRGGAGDGQQRFAPLNSWPDNVNLDKARRLLWPIKQKYGSKISWADLMILAGNVALESMGFKTFGFGGGRVDTWEPEMDIYWGPEGKWLADERYSGERDLENPLGAVQMGLIYVNPEGPNGNPDPLAAARDIRETFARMAMNDEETVALIAGGHTFGKTHGAADPSQVCRPRARGRADRTAGAGLEEQLRQRPWRGHDRQRPGSHLDHDADEVEQQLLREPVRLRMGADQEPRRRAPVEAQGGRRRRRHSGCGRPVQASRPGDADHRPRAAVRPGLRKDLAALLRAPRSVRRRVRARLVQADAPRHGPDRALSRPARAEGAADLAGPGPRRRSSADRRRGDRGAEGEGPRLRPHGVAARLDRLGVGLDLPRLRQARRRQRRAHSPRAAKGLGGQPAGRAGQGAGEARAIQKEFNASQSGGKKVSLADLIVLAGGAAIEKAAKDGRMRVKVPFTPGRTDASQEQTDAHSFAPLEPTADGFRNYIRGKQRLSAEELLTDRAQLLRLTAPEMTALVGGLRVLGANVGRSSHGVFTKQPETLTNDFFVNLLDASTQWAPAAGAEGVFEGRDRKTNAVKWTATRVDLIFGSHSQLRALAEVYASADAKEKFAKDFVAAWTKVMNADRFDLA